METALFLSWIRCHGRSADLAPLLDAEAVFIATGRRGNRWTAPARYAVQAVRTVSLLARRRPKRVIAMAPPDTLVAILRVYALLRRAHLTVDAHSGAVLGRDGAIRRRFVWLTRESPLVLVTSDMLVQMLRLRGVTALRLDDPVRALSRLPPPGERRVLVPASWYDDEPWQELLRAAAELPDVTFDVTGAPPAEAARLKPDNVRFTGYVTDDAYAELLDRARVVVALTTREGTMQRAGYEALAHGRPLVVSDTQVLREYFTKGAVLTLNDAPHIAAAVRSAVADAERLAVEIGELCAERSRRFDEDLASVRRATGLGAELPVP